MTYKELIQISKHVIGKSMRLDPISRLYGSPVFKQKKKRIPEEDIRAFQDQLLRYGIYSNLHITPRRYLLKVTRGPNPMPRKKYGVNIVLFLLTILTTMMTGAMLRGKDPFASWDNLQVGIPYSFALMTILFFHEMGHYLTARKYKVHVNLPYFIPIFLPAFHPGTMGAFIRMKSSIPNKRALFDIGIAGPLAGFVMSLVFLTIGFSRLPDQAGIYRYIEQIHPLNSPDAINLVLGKSLIYEFFCQIFDGHRLPMNEMYHFPFIFAGWFGLLVTALNLMPIGQLDGGHIAYAMHEDKARGVALVTFGLLILLNVYIIYVYNSYVWVLWPLLILFFIRFRHPPTLDNRIGLNTTRRILGWLAYIIFIVSFSPMPLYIQP